MIVRHNTELLEKAIRLAVERAELPTRLAEASMALQHQRERAKFLLSVGSAIAIAAIGLGIGIYFMREQKIVKTDAAQIVEALNPKAKTSVSDQSPVSAIPKTDNQSPSIDKKKPVESTQNSEPDKPTQVPSNPIVTNFTKFNSTKVHFLDRDWDLTVGHQYAQSEDKDWTSAWCYSSANVDNVSIKVDLAYRSSPNSNPIVLVASPETLTKSGLNELTAMTLALKCPWADSKNYTINDLIVAPTKRNLFSESDTKFELNGRLLFVSGAIGEGFAKKIASFDFDTLVINSPGGLVSESLAAATWLYKNGKATAIADSCFSACVYVVAGGKQRAAFKDSKIGVHQFSANGSLSLNSAVSSSQELSAGILALFKLSGISDEMFYKVSSVPSDDIAIIDHGTLLAWRYLTTELPTELAKIGDASVTPASPIEDRTKIVFQAREGFDLPGNDLANMPIRDLDLGGCEKACRQDDQCFAFTFNSKAQACFLKSDASVLLTSTDAISAYRAEKGALLENPFGTDTNSLLDGKAYRTKEDTNYGSCLMDCFNDGQCKGFSYNLKSKQCLLFDNFVEAYNKRNWESGVKSQNTE